MSVKVTPYSHSALSKKQQVAAMFNNIAWRYDFLNHFLSFGIDKWWRRKAINTLRKDNPKLILDIATGTGDLAIAALRLNPVKVIGIDISADMLELGRKKIKQRKLQDKIQLLEGDSEKLIFEDNKFDAVTVAFGVRNFENLEKGLNEIYRVLKPGGKVVILEFSQPANPLYKKFYHFYSTKICPLIGQVVSKDKAAYTYLHESVQAFPFGNVFDSILSKTGFRKTNIRTLTGGVASIYTGTK